MGLSAEDLAIVEELEKVREQAQQCLEHNRRQTESAVPLPFPSPNIHSLAQPTIAALEAHPLFKDSKPRFFDGKQLLLGPAWQAGNLVRVAAERNSSLAVEWLHKVFSTTAADLRYAAEVYGLETIKRITLRNGVSLMPFKDLPSSRNSRALADHCQTLQFPIIGPMWPPIGAILEVSQVRSSATAPEVFSDELERSIGAFTLADGAAPVMGVSWIDFVDSDLAKAEVGFVGMASKSDGAMPHFAEEIRPEAIEWVDRYLQLTPDVKRICDVALERLNLARRRTSPGNIAIEGAICLEALLSGEDSGDLTYKLKLRAALLLATDLEQRRAIQKTVGDFYKLRSRTVHGDVIKAGDAQLHTCAAKGLEICARVLRKIVERNEKPVPSDWELMGGVTQSDRDVVEAVSLTGKS